MSSTRREAREARSADEPNEAGGLTPCSNRGGRNIAALFCTPGSVYKTMDGVEVFDEARDATTFDLSVPVVAHPPCRAWGRMAHWSKHGPYERDLAHWAIHVARHCGGVVEHPITSRLWREIGSGTPGVRDRFGGVLLTVHQSWWGHRAQKATGLYVVGPVPDEMPCDGPAPTRVVQAMGQPERLRTPSKLAAWLVRTARAAA